MNTIIEWLNTPVFTLFNVPTTIAELGGFATGLLCVALVALQRIENFSVGIVNNLLWIVLFLSAGLYADSFLQVVFIGIAIWGWWAWLRLGPNRTALIVSKTSRNQWLLMSALGVAGTYGMYLFLEHLTNSTVPLWDGITLVLSLLAIWGQCLKLLESWWLWMAVDIIGVPLYLYKGLTLTAILYVGFFALCVYGLIKWRKAFNSQRNSTPVNPVNVTVTQTASLSTLAEDLS